MCIIGRFRSNLIRHGTTCLASSAGARVIRTPTIAAFSFHCILISSTMTSSSTAFSCAGHKADPRAWSVCHKTFSARSWSLSARRSAREQELTMLDIMCVLSPLRFLHFLHFRTYLSLGCVFRCPSSRRLSNRAALPSRIPVPASRQRLPAIGSHPKTDCLRFAPAVCCPPARWHV